MHHGGSDTAPIMQCGPMNEGHHSGTVDELLERFPVSAKFAHPTVCRCDGQRHEDQEGQPTRPDIEFRDFPSGEGHRPLVNKVQHCMPKRIKIAATPR